MAGVTAQQDFEVGEELGHLEEWLLRDPLPLTNGFDIDDLIEDQGFYGLDTEITELDHSKGLCSEFSAFEDLLVNSNSSSSPISSNNSISNISDVHDVHIGIDQRQKNIQAVTPSDVDENKKNNFQEAQETAQASAVKICCESPKSKRRMRLVKNREAACQSRMRKKCYIQDLESKCGMLENYCNQLQQSIAFTCAENAVLRDDLCRCKRQKGSNGVAEPAVPKDSLPSESPSHLTTLAVAGHLTGVRCLGWLLAAMILLFLGELVKPSSTNSISHTENGYKSSTFSVFVNLDQRRRVFESYPGTRTRAFSSCRHHYWKLNNFFPPFQFVF